MQKICVCEEHICQTTASNERGVGSGSDDGIATEATDHIKGAVCVNRLWHPASWAKYTLPIQYAQLTVLDFGFKLIFESNAEKIYVFFFFFTTFSLNHRPLGTLQLSFYSTIEFMILESVCLNANEMQF